MRDRTWQALNDRLRALAREQEEKRSRPTAAVLDSQSVKSDGHGGEVGYGAAKRSRGANGICWWTRWGWFWASLRPARPSATRPRSC